MRFFVAMCRDILENGVSTEGEKVRPKWEDGDQRLHFIKKFGVVNRYDLAKEFPALTLRRTAIKKLYQRDALDLAEKSNNIHDPKSSIWDEWADENGSIGSLRLPDGGSSTVTREGMMDQVDRVIYDLKNNPFSRRIMTNIYVHQTLRDEPLSLRLQHDSSSM